MCTRAMHTNKDAPYKGTITGRNFDWGTWADSSLWIYPAGMERNGAAGKDYSHEWVSDYKSVTVANYGTTGGRAGSTSDGLNEKGLMANLLWLTGSVYYTLNRAPEKTAISVSAWTQFILDKCANVREAITKMKGIHIVATDVPGGKTAQCHLSVSDEAGNSAIFEYVGGTLIIHSNVKVDPSELDKDIILHYEDVKKVWVMTNEPTFDQQLKLNAYWEYVDGQFLPGTCSPVDRFVRATYYNNRLPEPGTSNEALAHVLSIMHTIVEPFEIEKKGLTIIPTQYVSLADHTNKFYYFGPARSPFISWIDLNKIDLFPEGLPLNLTFEENGTLITGGKLSGGQLTAADFTSAKPFPFLEVTVPQPPPLVTV